MNLGIAYESSDEEDIGHTEKPQKAPTDEPPAEDPRLPATQPQPILESTIGKGSLVGPAGPPTCFPLAISDTLEDVPPGSPYSSTRAITRNLTLPTVPDFDIPPSPPGSPQIKAESFTRFLELKKKGEHYNRRWASSEMGRDPGIVQNLFQHVGIKGEAQYMTTLPTDVAIPTTFPAWAYAEKLRESQKKIEEANASKPRDSIEFVAAARAGTPGGVRTGPGREAHQSAAERVMAGLERQPSEKREDSEKGRAREESSSQRRRARSRSRTRR